MDVLAPFVVIFVGMSLAAMVIWIWALVDCVRVQDDSMYQSGNKLIWVLIIVFLHFIGAILYVVIGKPRAGGAPPPRTSDPWGGGAGQRHVTPPPPPGSLP